MDFMNIGDNISYNDYNALVYLLRKFKKLSTSLKFGANDLTSEYGNFHFSDGFENIGNNFILNNDVTITSDTVLQNAFYSFIFTVIDVNLSGEVNKRFIEISGGTSENSELNIVLPKDLINDDEVLLPDFRVDVTFDLHEYYTPRQSLKLDISADKLIHSVNDPVTITVKVQNALGVVKDANVTIYDSTSEITLVSDENGEVQYTIGQIHDRGTFLVSATVGSVTKSIDLVMVDYIIKATFVTDTVDVNLNFPKAPGNTNFIAIDWGDTDYPEILYTNTVRPLHKYNNSDSHEVLFGINVFELGVGCFSCDYLERIIIPEGIKVINMGCLSGDLTYISLPKSLTYVSSGVLDGLDADFDLNWLVVPENCRNRDFGSANSIFYIPYGTTSEYVNAGFPYPQLREKEPPYLFKPALDGTDNITSWTNLTNKTENGVFTSHGSFLTDGWSNDGLWQLDFDYCYTETRYVGLMPICISNINPFTDAKRDANAITSWEGSFPFGSGKLSWSESPASWSKPSQTSWNHVTVKKTSDTTIEIILNATYKWVGTLSVLPNWDTLHIGSRDNPSSRNSGGSILYKNIEVKRI